MNEKTNLGLVEWARSWLSEAYWYGTCCYNCTSSLLVSKTAQYPSHYTEVRMPRYRTDIATGKRCADCIGLIKGYHWVDDLGNIKYLQNGTPDVNTSGMFNNTKIKGLIATMPEVPGLIVYKSGHVGVYEGEGHVIEAKGFAYGVVRSTIKETAWTHWLMDPWISYDGYEEMIGFEKIIFPCAALVATRVDPHINIWQDARKSKSLLKVNRGDTLYVIGPAEVSGWYIVFKDGVRGFADAQYLTLFNADIPDGIDDDAQDADNPPVDFEYLYRAKVTGVSQGLNLRTTPARVEGNTFDILRMDAIVYVLAENQGKDGTFAQVRYQNETGYCTGSYLIRLNK